MALEQTITIVNNSGKIISTGKQLFSIFKEAKGAYQDKKSQIKSDKLQRAQTFDHYPTSSRALQRPQIQHDERDYYDEEEDDDYYYKYEDEHRAPRQRESWYDGHSEAPSRASRRSRSVTSRRHHHQSRGDRGSQYGGSSRPPLTINNLKTHSEVSSTAPSRAPPGNYRNPYAETLAASRMDLTHADMRSLAPTERRPETALTRRRSFSQIDRRSTYHAGENQMIPHHDAYHDKEIDMNLAYGDIPPDLEHRLDLDPAYQLLSKESKAKALTRKVETLLDEAKCVQHSATSTISHLQQNPDAAAAVALTLAELSTVITKMSPAFLGMLKGGSPAVFALLASPQFLIGTGAVVGVTVVMFGGWKIVKKVKEQQLARQALAYEGVPMDRPAPLRTQSEFSTGMDEALIMDDDLSTIDTWRRGIPAYGDNESADLELITPEADRATRRDRGHKDDDLRSHRSTRTSRTAKTTKTNKTSKTTKREEVPERKSSRTATAESVAGTERSKKTSSKKKEKAAVKAIEDGRSRKEDDAVEMVFRPKPLRQGSNMLKALFKDKKEKDARSVVYA